MPKVTLKAAVGFTRFASDIKDSGVPNYMDYSVGGAYDFGSGLSLGCRGGREQEGLLRPRQQVARDRHPDQNL